MKRIFSVLCLGVILGATPTMFVVAANPSPDALTAAPSPVNTLKTIKVPSNRLQLTETNYDQIFTQNPIARQVKNDSGEFAVRRWFRGSLVLTTNAIIAIIAILYLAILGAKYVMAQGQDDKMSEYKTQFGFIIVGLATVSMAEFAAYSIFDPTHDVISGGQSIKNFEALILRIKLFFQYIVGAVVLLTGTMSGYNLITASESGETETVDQEKTFLKSFFFGAALILLAEVVVQGVLYAWNPVASTHTAMQELAGVINFSLMFLVGVATFMLILSSLYYVISMGNEDTQSRAKKIIIGSVIGLILAFSSYTISYHFLFVPYVS